LALRQKFEKIHWKKGIGILTKNSKQCFLSYSWKYFKRVNNLINHLHLALPQPSLTYLTLSISFSNEQLFYFISFYNCFSTEEVKLDETTTRCALSGCEFDYSSNTYRIHVELTCGSITIGEHFLVVKIDPCTGFPKICSIKWSIQVAKTITLP
jgi:hypothetical protein